MSELTEEEQRAMKMKAALEASEKLPEDTFAAVPDEDIVTIEVSGQFGRVINKVLEYLYQCEDEKTVVHSANMVANNFDGLKQEEITPHSLALWAVSNLLANFSMNAGVQNKTKIYDKNKIMTHIFGGVSSKEPLVPLTPEELKERQLSLDKAPAERTGVVSLEEKDAIKNRDARRLHREQQKLNSMHKRAHNKVGPRGNLTDEDIQARLNKNKKEIDDTNPED